jgi:hypothetical protein
MLRGLGLPVAARRARGRGRFWRVFLPWVAVSLAITALAAWHLVPASQWPWSRLTGETTGVVETAGSKGVGEDMEYFSTVQYRVAGKTYRIQSDAYQHHKGEAVSIRYDPGQPGDGVVSAYNRFVWILLTLWLVCAVSIGWLAANDAQLTS